MNTTAVQFDSCCRAEQGVANAVVVARWSCHVFVTIVYMAIIVLSRIRDNRPVSVNENLSQCNLNTACQGSVLSAQWVSKFGHSACNNWPHPGNEPSVQTSVQAWSWHMHNLNATWTCLMFFVHYLIAARILLATTRPCDVSNTMAHA